MSLHAITSGYLITAGFVGCGYWLCGYAARERLRAPRYGIVLLALAHALAVYAAQQIHWMATLLLLFPFLWALCRAIDIEPYKLAYLMTVSSTYAFLGSLACYLLFGSSYTWGWSEAGWIALGLLLTLPMMTLLVRRVIWPRLCRFDLPGRKWLTVAPVIVITTNQLVASSRVQHLTAGGYEWVYIVTMAILAIGSIAFDALFFIVMGKMQDALNVKNDLRIVAEQIATQRHRHAEIMRYVDDMRIVRHDMRHHFRVVDGLLRSGRLDELKAYLAEYETSMRQNESMIHSRNCISEMVLRHTLNVATEAGIKVNVQCGLPESIWMDDCDLSTLLGNLTENALNACRLQAEGAREIKYTARARGEEVFIQVENTCGDAALDTPHRRSALGIEKSSGCGILSIKTVTAKYNGAAMLTRENGRYVASILLYKPHRMPQRADPLPTPVQPAVNRVYTNAAAS